MKKFMDENFLLETQTAQQLFHEHANKMPIFDFHCHIPPKNIAMDVNFDTLGQVWLGGDHYKWRAMRTNGVEEKYCSGNASDYEKFEKWAETMPFTMRNPLYHWTHLELQRFFNVTDLLNKQTCKKIYDHCSSLLKTPEYSVRNLIKMMNVKVICTTDDPIDSLEHHKKIKDDGFEVKVLPTFRPDKLLAVHEVNEYGIYIKMLEDVSGIEINNFSSLIDAIDSRHAFFHDMGCRSADHGVLILYSEDYDDSDIEEYLNRALSGEILDPFEILEFRSALLYELALLNHKRGWVQQFHFGAMRNNNSRLFNELGPDTGFDSIGDDLHADDISDFLNRLDETNQLAKTVLFNMNPKDNAMVAAMTGNFQDGSTPGKIQFGPSWWFLDQKEGIINQLNTLSSIGLLSRFIGMTTDSRSFLSYPRHEYFRRILCNLIGNDVEKGELPADMDFLGTMVENICYNNVKKYFNLH